MLKDYGFSPTKKYEWSSIFRDDRTASPIIYLDEASDFLRFHWGTDIYFVFSRVEFLSSLIALYNGLELPVLESYVIKSSSLCYTTFEIYNSSMKETIAIVAVETRNRLSFSFNQILRLIGVLNA